MITKLDQIRQSTIPVQSIHMSHNPQDIHFPWQTKERLQPSQTLENITTPDT